MQFADGRSKLGNRTAETRWTAPDFALIVCIWRYATEHRASAHLTYLRQFCTLRTDDIHQVVPGFNKCLGAVTLKLNPQRINIHSGIDEALHRSIDIRPFYCGRVEVAVI